MAVVSFPARNKLAYPAGTRAGFDPTHPAAFGLRSVFSAVYGNGNFVDVTKGRPGTIDATGFTPQIDSIIGRSLLFTNSTNNISFPLPDPNWDNSNFIIAAIITLPAATVGANSFIIGTFSSTNGGVNLAIQANQTSLCLLDNSATFFWPFFDFGTAGLAGKPVFVAMSATAANTAFNWVVRDLSMGRMYSGGPVTWGGVGAPEAAGNVINIGNRDGGARPFVGGSVAAVMQADNAQKLSVAQLQQFANDPWAFWYPPQAMSLVAAAAAASTTVLYSLMNVG